MRTSPPLQLSFNFLLIRYYFYHHACTVIILTRLTNQIDPNLADAPIVIFTDEDHGRINAMGRVFREAVSKHSLDLLYN